MDPFHHDWDTRSFAAEHRIQYMYCPFTHPPTHPTRAVCAHAMIFVGLVLVGRIAPSEPSGWAGGSPRSTTRSSTTRCWSASRKSTTQTSHKSSWRGECFVCPFLSSHAVFDRRPWPALPPYARLQSSRAVAIPRASHADHLRANFRSLASDDKPVSLDDQVRLCSACHSLRWLFTVTCCSGPRADRTGTAQGPSTLSSFLSTLSTSLGTHHFLVLFLQLDGILGEPWDEEWGRPFLRGGDGDFGQVTSWQLSFNSPTDHWHDLCWPFYYNLSGQAYRQSHEHSKGEPSPRIFWVFSL